jgi:hypothetical protein
MNCPQCSASHENLDRFCRQCGTSLSLPIHHNASTSGDHSFNAGLHNTFTGNTINFDSDNSEPRAYIERVKTRPLTVGGHPVKAAWVIFSGVLGMVGSVASIWSVWQTGFQYLWLVLLGFSMVALLLGTVLNRQRFARLTPFLTIESNKAGALFLTTIEGECPKCDGVLKLRDVGEKEHRSTLVRCTRNPDHFWLFDPTVLGEPGAEDIG